MKKAAFVALFTLSAWGCTLTDAQAGPEGDASSETALDSAVASGLDLAVGLGDAAEWVGTTTSGIGVTVRPGNVPVLVGVTAFQISFERAVPDDVPVSIDVISPEMPVMGLMRYPAERSGPNTYTSSADIRMAGAWEIYVNLGDGTDTAPFAFDVQASDPGSDNHGGGH
jgi:hypothetical protein